MITKQSIVDEWSLRIRQVTIQYGQGGNVWLETGSAVQSAKVQVSVFGPKPGQMSAFSREPGFFGLAGVQVPWLRQADQEAEMILAAASGAKIIGMDFEWRKIQPEPHRFDWEATDQAVRLAKKYNIKIVPMLMFTPEWASAYPFAAIDYHKTMPVNVIDYRDFVYQVVTRYKPYGEFAETRDGYGITDWVIWNEPNIQGKGSDPMPMGFWYDTLESYILLLRAGYEGAHAADPLCNVLNGGLADVHWKPGEADIVTAVERLYDPDGDGNANDGARPFFDTLNLHIYPPGILYGSWYRDRLDAILRIMKRYGDEDKKIWITETGLGASNQLTINYQQLDGNLPLVSDVDQARGVELAYSTLADYPQVEKVFWWSLRNYSSNDAVNNPLMEAHYGLVGVNFIPRLAFHAYMRLAARAGFYGAIQVDLNPSGWTQVTLPEIWLKESGPYLLIVQPVLDKEITWYENLQAILWLVNP